MDPQRVREREAQCVQEQPPACNAACPIHVDARSLIECVRQGDFKGGFAILARYVPFPSIIARTCDHPCEASCKRGEAGEVIRIGDLERACAEYGSPAPERFRLPAKTKRVAVVGGGLSGLTAAADLGAKGYTVEVFEARSALLERLRALGEEILPEWMIEADLAQLLGLGVTIHCDTPVEAESGYDWLVQEFDAIYLAIGPVSAYSLSHDLVLTPEGQIEIAPLTFATSHPKIFAGGMHRYAPLDYSPMRSLQDGLYAALSIDRFLQGASLSANRESQGPFTTRLHVVTSGIESLPAVEPADPSSGYTSDEAVREAARCFPCQCLECVKVCEYLAHYGSYPKRYVREIYNNDCIVMGAHQANRMVNSCTLCGLCAAVCPEKLSMAEACLEARQSMVAKGKMPPSAHDFALQDMAFSTGPAFALERHAPDTNSSAAVFFPGCQLAGSSPDHVFETYRHLRETIPGGVGLVLGCCGAPAHWAGRDEMFQGVLRSVSEIWSRMGKPRFITACSSCYRMLKDGLPEIQIESLWTVLEPPPSSLPKSDQPKRTLAIHDPCTTRGEDGVQDGVRRILERLGIEVLELNQRGFTTCCGYGGLARFVNPEVTDKIVKRRIEDASADYLTYCAMCRDSFARQGKRAVHILDLLFGLKEDDQAVRPDPGFSRRHENRARLKTRLLREVWKESVEEERPPMNLTISPEVQALLERRMILLDDVRRVIEQAESTGAKLEDARTGRFIACLRPVSVTYWVEYSATDSGFVVHNAYSHRMQVE